MRRTVKVFLSLVIAGCWVLFGATDARAQNQGDETVIVVIDGVEYVLDGSTALPPGFDQFDPFGPLPSDVVVLGDGQPLPPGFFGDIPPGYEFFVDPTLPVPEEFAFLDDPRLPVPAEYAFMFDARLPVPPEWEWLFPEVPGQVPVFQEPIPTSIAEATPTPTVEPDEATPEPEETAQIAVDLSSLADDDALAATQDGEATTVSAEAAAEEPAPQETPVPEVEEDVADEPAVVATQNNSTPAPERNASSNLLVPLLIFVAVASTALLASIPVFWRQRSSADTALRELALTDDLTRLANRRRLDRDLRVHNRGKDVIAVAMIDIDHFKRLNDDFSHAVGDLVLQHVAATISQNVRANDVAYRYGGEEFCVLLPGASENEAAAVVDRVRRAVESLSFEVLDRNVTVSAGVASAAPGQAQGEHAMVRRADAALYAAKNSGRNRVMLSSLVERAKSKD